MKRLLTITLGLALGLSLVSGCGPSAKKDDEFPTVKDLRNRGKPADPKAGNQKK